jgi:hypothetical protein
LMIAPSAYPDSYSDNKSSIKNGKYGWSFRIFKWPSGSCSMFDLA